MVNPTHQHEHAHEHGHGGHPPHDHGGHTHHDHGGHAHHGQPAREAAVQAAPEGTIYTCPMHPEIRQPKPGSCPICGMALEPLMPALEEEENPELADFRRRLADHLKRLDALGVEYRPAGGPLPWQTRPDALGWPRDRADREAELARGVRNLGVATPPASGRAAG